MHGDRQRQRLRAATALEQVHDEVFALPFENQPQRRRRRLAGTGCRTKDEEQRLTRLGSQLQAAQRGGLDLRQPDDDGTDTIGGQRAFAGPGGIATGSTGNQQAREIDAPGLQCRCIKQIGRGNADQPGQFVTRKTGQRRQQQAQFADAVTPRQEFGQTAARPATTGQLAVEIGETRRHARQRCPGQRIPPPDIGTFEDLRQRGR